MSSVLRRLPLLLRNNSRSMSSAKLVDVKVNDKTGVATVSMQRPPVNSLNLELLTELRTTMEELETNKARGMILTSSSPSVFSAGLDIMEMFTKVTPRDRQEKFWSTLQDVWLKLYGSPYPTVAAIRGHSPAGGCLLACCCEYRVMVSGKYTIGLNETQLGIVAPRWFMDSMLSVLPTRQSELALTTGKLFTVDEASKAGLIDEVASDKDDAILRAEKWLESFAKISPKARNLTKQFFRQDVIRKFEENRDMDLQMFLFSLEDPKVQKGLEIYIESLKKKKN